MSCFTCFSTELDLRIDDYVVPKGDSQNITFNLVQFQVDILGVFFDGFKICFQKKWISVRIDCSKVYSKESNSVSLLKCYDVSVDQTTVKIKKKNQIIVTVMMWGRPEFINDRNLERRFKGFWEDSAVRSSKNFARGIPMPGMEPVPWRWKRQILIDEFHVDIVRAFFDVCKIFFQ